MAMLDSVVDSTSKPNAVSPIALLALFPGNEARALIRRTLKRNNFLTLARRMVVTRVLWNGRDWLKSNGHA
ncbi:cytokinesis protein sepA [Histoplasma capsulatum var. duboisii H88]|uniref:Cytokinesis protein sepA n=1 Tax=Ajellomyces capsulatus (strain H88) TaxID=544711 RepID=A0A8A1L9S1_AJEC8|nr:cytokinesis protein sepA [Histoplasma capsulatum var. duboisii H88]